jgi:tetratricopeptide (TPR) repeat protein
VTHAPIVTARGGPWGGRLLLLVALATVGAWYEWGGPAGRGLRALRAGKGAEAAAALEEARRADPASATLRYDQALAFRAAGMADSARAAFRDARRLDGADARAAAAYNAANASMRADRVEDAIEGYRASLREDPTRADAKRNLEEALLRARAASPTPQSGSSGTQGSGQGGTGQRPGGASPPPAGSPAQAKDPPRQRGDSANRSLGAETPSQEEAEHWLDALEAERRAGRSREQAGRRAASEGRTAHDW